MEMERPEVGLEWPGNDRLKHSLKRVHGVSAGALEEAEES